MKELEDFLEGFEDTLKFMDIYDSSNEHIRKVVADGLGEPLALLEQARELHKPMPTYRSEYILDEDGYIKSVGSTYYCKTCCTGEHLKGKPVCDTHKALTVLED